jgi:hypothetical protein
MRIFKLIVMPKKGAKKGAKKRGYKRRAKHVPRIGTRSGRKLTEQFPAELRTTLSVVSSNEITLPIGTGDNCACHLAFKASCILNCGPAFQEDDAHAFAAYATNFPCGINYLLGAQTFSNTQKAPYSKFVVLGSKITLKICPNASAVNPVFLVLWPNTTINQASAGSVMITQSVANLLEQPDSKYMVMSELYAADGLVMTHKMSTKRMFGLTRNLASQDITYTGNYNTDPAQIGNWVLSMNNANQAATSTGVSLAWKIDYDVIFFNRNIFTSTAPT